MAKKQVVASVDETQTSAVPVQSVPASPNEFSNAIAADGAARRINVIALDLINTPFLDQVGARRAAIRYLANNINQDAIFELVSIALPGAFQTGSFGSYLVATFGNSVSLEI